jgi:sulfatase modifying factor 1
MFVNICRAALPLTAIVVTITACRKEAPNIELVRIEAGTFMMGSSPKEKCRERGTSLKETLHETSITRAFFIGKYEVTQDQFESVRGYNPVYQNDVFYPCIGGSCAATSISWHNAAAFCNELSALEDLEQCYECTGEVNHPSCNVRSDLVSRVAGCRGFRLPTEAEWEYSYRAGNSTSLYSGDNTVCEGTEPKAEPIAWYRGNANWVKEVGMKQPNAWGIFDMAGNVAEWTGDGGQQDLGVSKTTDPESAITNGLVILRGGCYDSQPYLLRAAQRLSGPQNEGAAGMGFRIARTE